MNLLISRCLLGLPCRYDGKRVPLPEEDLRLLRRNFTLIPVCPETDGGLPVPRVPAERVGDRVINKAGEDVTEEYRRGAQIALDQAIAHGCRLALLKERSPSCGAGQIYDGTFSGVLIPGDGVAAALLKDHGVAVYGESKLSNLPTDGKETL